MPKELKKTKYILKRAKNGRKRVKHATTALYAYEQEDLKQKAKAFAQKLGHSNMSVSAYINIKLLLPGN